MTDFGTDVSTWNGKDPPDLDPYFTLIRGRRLLCEVALRRIFCLPGSYTQAPGFKSIDLIAMVNQAQSSFDSRGLSEQASAAIRSDERFNPAGTLATIDLVGDTITAKLQLMPADGTTPFVLTVKVAQFRSSKPLFDVAFPVAA